MGDPLVVFAVRPQRGFVKPLYMVQEKAEFAAADPNVRPVWYKCVLPNDEHTVGYSTRSDMRQFGQAMPKNQVVFAVAVDPVPGGPVDERGVRIEWLLDATGEPVNIPEPSELYRMSEILPGDNRQHRPPVESWRLEDLPSVQNASTLPS